MNIWEYADTNTWFFTFQIVFVSLVIGLSITSFANQPKKVESKDTHNHYYEKDNGGM